MKEFLKKISIFIFFLVLLGEIIIRLFHLAPDIPERYIDKYGIQRYKPNQSGYYDKEKWNVNKYGWMGVCEVNKDTIISIIGDSYIENISNPISCNQGSYLKAILPKYSYFEAGRAGVTFIEALEISKILAVEVAPNYQLIYVNENDFYESISEIARYDDRLQISLTEQKIMLARLKNPFVKQVLYNFKLLYYLYLKYPIFVANQNKEAPKVISAKNKKFDVDKMNKLFSYCSSNYNLKNLVLVFNPDVDKKIISIAQQHGINSLVLNSTGDKLWSRGVHEVHWSCYGQRQVSKQVAAYLKKYCH